MSRAPTRGCIAGPASALLLLLPAGALAAQAPAADRVQYGVTQSADTVTVGDPFRIVVRVRAPLGAAIEFPAGPDTTGPVQRLDPPVAAATPDPGAVDQSVTFRVAAWDVGTVPIALGELVVRTPMGMRRITIPAESIHVRSVLPADSAQRVPKPVRPVFGTAAPFPWWWLLLAALAVGSLVAWWWHRRRRRQPGPANPEDAYAHAMSEFARIDQLGLIDVGERGRHVALVVDVVRDYLQARHADARLSHTSTELLLALRGRPSIPAERLGAILAEGDLVKFARRAVSSERARQLGADARSVVESVEQALRRAAAEAEAARARAAGQEKAA